MNVAIIDNNGQVTQIGDYRTVFPQTSFPPSGPTDEFLSQNSALKVNAWRSYDATTEKLVSCEPYVEAGSLYTVQVEPLTADDIAARTSERASEVRRERNRRLTDTDWTQTLDSQVDRPSWQVYRQALRDIPQQPGFPTTVEWPVEPTS